MKYESKLFRQPQARERLPAALSDDDKNKIKEIALGIGDVPEDLRMVALSDLLERLESNSHPLNKIYRNENGEISLFVVFDDQQFEKGYIKYFGTDNKSGLSAFVEIPALLDEAREKGYEQLSFHGWNKRLNKILTRFGFEKKGSENWNGEEVDYYVLDLKKDEKQEAEEGIPEYYRQKQLQKIISDTNDFIQKHISEERREEVLQKVQRVKNSLLQRIEQETEVELTDIQKANLELKLVRYFQNNESLDENTLFDALVESPKFLNKSKGSIHRLFELHQQNTLLKIAEMRKKRAEQNGEGFNPWEALYETDSGKYYMARLLNMPHLEEESEFMNHCVGTSDSYINKIKKGNIEILSFRNKSEINSKSGKLEGDSPLITIEYNPKTGRIEQIKKADDEYLSYDDPFYQDFVEALQKLQETEMDDGKKRRINGINTSELKNIQVATDYVATGRGEIPTGDFDFEKDFVLKAGEFTTATSDEKLTQIINKQEGKNYAVGEVARTVDEITEETRCYIGDLTDKDYKLLNNRKNPLDVLGGANFRSWTPLISLPENIFFSGDVSFGGCKTLTTLPENISFGGNVNFGSCASLTSLPKNISFDGWVNFRDCTSLTTLPENISFGSWVNFEGCTSLTFLPENISFGGDVNFKGCTSLRSLPENISFGGDVSFEGCTSLTSLPENISFGGRVDFRGCTSLTSLLENISFGDWVDFEGCTSLTSLPENISFGDWVDFRGCTSLTSLPENISFGGGADFRGCPLSQKDKDRLKKMKEEGKIPGELYL